MFATLAAHRKQDMTTECFIRQHIREYRGNVMPYMHGYNLETVDDWENATLYRIPDLLASALEQLGEPVITTRKHNLWVCETCGQALANDLIIRMAIELMMA